MLDDFRQQASESSFEEEAEPQERRGGLLSRIHFPEGNILGLSAQQRFIIILMLLILIVLGGAAGLLLTGKVVPVF
jgi:hypothetical protein